MNIIIDYGVGNLDSLKRACEELDFQVVVSNKIEEISNATSIILPGVGAYEAAMNELINFNLVEMIKEKAINGIPILGICLGMQLLYEYSDENGGCEGLGLLKGTVKEIPNFVKVPHMGWNKLFFNKNSNLLKYVKEEEYVYFVHSYYISSSNEEVVAFSDYGVKIPAIVMQDNIVGMQFHPEKSSETGLKLLKAFKELCLYDSISSN